MRMLFRRLSGLLGKTKPWIEVEGEVDELPNDILDQFLKDNPLDATFDLEEHPDVEFRSFLKCRPEGGVDFAQMDARAATLFVLAPYPDQKRLEYMERLLKSTSYFGRLFTFDPLDNDGLIFQPNLYNFDTFYGDNAY